MLEHLREQFSELLANVLFAAHPALKLSALVSNLKTASARKLKRPFAAQIRKFYWKPGFWSRAYYLASVGNASLETVKRYVASQLGAA